MVPISKLRASRARIDLADLGIAARLDVERKRGGKIALICPCDFASSSGWCMHMVDFLVGRINLSQYACDIEDIYFDTSLAELARELSLAIETFDKAVAHFPLSRPNLSCDALDKFAAQTMDVQLAAEELSKALNRFCGEIRRGLSESSTLRG